MRDPLDGLEAVKHKYPKDDALFRIIKSGWKGEKKVCGSGGELCCKDLKA